ncbi:MAG: hypothetical protein RIB43_08860 [Rhodospirillaceae bacterium]
MTDQALTVLCRTPTLDKKPTSIPVWKFEALSKSIRDILKSAGSGGVLFADLPDLVRAQLSQEDLLNLGSVSWHVTTVKLELEVRGEIMRSRGAGKQRLYIKSE